MLKHAEASAIQEAVHVLYTGNAAVTAVTATKLLCQCRLEKDSVTI